MTTAPSSHHSTDNSGNQNELESRLAALERENALLRSALEHAGDRAICTHDLAACRRMEHELNDARHRLGSFISQAPGFFFTALRESDGGLSMPFVSAGVTEIYGLDPLDVMRDCSLLYERVHQEDLDNILAATDESADNQMPLHQEFRVCHPEKGERWIEARSLPHRGSDGTITWHSVQHDITERKETEFKLHMQQSLMRTIFDTIPDLVWMKSVNGVYLSCNPAFEEFFGASEREICGKTDYDFVDAELATFFRQKDAEAVAADAVSINEETITYASDGRTGFLETRKVPVRGADGEVLAVLGIARDISERKQAETDLKNRLERILELNETLEDNARVLEEQTVELEASQKQLRTTETWYRGILHSAPDGMLVINEVGLITLVNDQLCRMFGYSEGELIGQAVEQLVPPDVRDMHAQNRRNFISGERSAMQTVVTVSACRKDGSTFVVDMTLSLLSDNYNGKSAVCAAVRDVTERQRMQEDLRERESFLGSLLDTIPLPVFYKDRQGRYLGFNRAYLDFFGGTKEQWMGKSVFDTHPEGLARIYHARDESLLAEGGIQRYEAKARNAQGLERDVIFNKAVFTDAHGRPGGLIGAIQDITERKNTEGQLKEALAFAEGIVTAIPDILFEVDRGGKYLNVWTRNPDVLAAQKKNLLGRSVGDVLSPEAARLAMHAIREASEKGVTFGHCLPIIDINGEVRWFDHSLAKKSGTSETDETFVVLSRDITERKRMELALQASEAALRLKNRLLQSMMDTAASVSIYALDHEYRYLSFNRTHSERAKRLRGIDIAIGMPMLDQFPDRGFREFCRRQFDQVILGQYHCAETREELVIDGLATVDYAENHGSPIFGEGGEVVGLTVFAINITERKRMEEDLLESERSFRTLAENAPDTIMRYDVDCRRTYLNPAFLNLIGLSADDLLGKTPTNYSTTEQAFLYEAALRRVLESGKPCEHEYTWQTASGREIISLFNIVPEWGSDGKIRSVLAIGRDITERKRMEAILALREQEFRSLIENTPDLIARYDHQFRRIYANPALVEATGRHYSELVGKRPTEVSVRSTQLVQFEERLAEAFTTGKEVHTKLEWERSTGDYVYSDFQIVPERNQTGSVVSVLAIGRDISQIALAEQRLNHMALHDALTGLPNRRLFHERLAQSMALSDQKGHSTILMLIDLDNFKTINDTLGHSVGDELLRAVAQQLRYALREDDTVARLGGDEFVVIINDVGESYDVDVGARHILNEIAQPFSVAGHKLLIRASMGISAYPHDAKDAEALLRSADTAMYHAKERGRDGFHRFSEELNQRIRDRAELAASLRSAIGNGEMELHYQPKMNIRDDVLSGMEALMRWNHPEHGLVPPGRFIPVAEESALIIEMGAWAIADTCRQINEWLTAGLDPVKVSVNLSPAQCRNRDIVDVVKQALESNNVPPRYLEMEITEGMVMQDTETATGIFWELREMGVSLSIDDFGTGQSSLAYLKRFPVDCLKIDRSFISDIHTGKGDDEIVRTIIAMARGLGMRVIAEGVETHDQMDFLRKNECDEIQGHIFSTPLTAQDVLAFLKREGEKLSTAGTKSGPQAH